MLDYSANDDTQISPQAFLADLILNAIESLLFIVTDLPVESYERCCVCSFYYIALIASKVRLTHELDSISLVISIIILYSFICNLGKNETTEDTKISRKCP
jgi:hypothetical protein